MPSMETTIGRGLLVVQVEYDIWQNDPLAVEVQDVFLFAKSAEEKHRHMIDVSGLLTDAVYQSLESDCLAHEIAVRRREAAEPIEPDLAMIGGY